MAFFEQINLIDATTLYSNTSVTAAFTSTAIDTMNYGSIVIEVDSTSGNVINAIVEGSNDGTDGWYSILLNPTQDLSVTDVITGEGHYTFNAQARYIRVNATLVSGGTYSIIIVGRSGAGPDAAEKLTAAFDKNTPLNVNLASGVLLDKSNAVILSDGIQYKIQGATGQYAATIDCTGYNSFSWHSSTQQIQILHGNDGINFYATYGYSSTYVAGNSTLSAGAVWTGPIFTKYLRIYITIAGNNAGTLTLKQAPSPFAPNFQNSGQGFQGVNIHGVAGSSISGYSGVPVQGGSIQNNAFTTTSSTGYPILIGGQFWDPNNLSSQQANTVYSRALVTDGAGRLIVASGVNPGANVPGPYTANTAAVYNTAIPGMATAGSNPYNVNVTLTQDTAHFEGQSTIELLAQILLELRIMNQQMYELPRLIASGQSSTDPPELMRVEPSIFTI